MEISMYLQSNTWSTRTGVTFKHGSILMQSAANVARTAFPAHILLASAVAWQ